ncbi:MAG TPA: heavy metal-binding domain-containing protein [Solirubrobacteraceae bacterium]|nr:heavy metal-binding domain-containing protein [Solirubrobacteraceae bacterium]
MSAWRTVGLFGKRVATLSEEERQAAAVDLERIAGGGIPLGAEERLKRIAASSSPVFTSDLSAKEYAIAQASGLAPIAQIMGSSVVQHGWQNYPWASYGGGISEMPAFAAPWNLSRERSFDRLRQEAQFAGADAVIGIELNTKAFLGEPGNVEYAVFGTAVRETTLSSRTPGQSAPGQPRMCALSAQDVDKLRRIGAETVGVIGHTSVVCVALSSWANQMMSSWWGNQELTELSEGVYAARELAMREVRGQASDAGANDIVISTLTHQVHHHEYESPGYRQHMFIISMHVLGTAIRLGAHEPHPAPLGVPVLSMNLGDQSP